MKCYTIGIDPLERCTVGDTPEEYNPETGEWEKVGCITPDVVIQK